MSDNDLMYEMGTWDAIAGITPAHPDNGWYMMGYQEAML